MQGFKKRYRMEKLRLSDVVWGIGAAVVGMAGMGAFSALSTKLIALGIIPVPDHLPLILDPGAVYNHNSLSQIVGGQISGNWRVILIYFIMLFFNIAGEELLWRGYILPRQELAFGKMTWLIHGLLWTMFHSFKWWDLLSLLPVCLIISFVAQKRKSIWPGFIAHYIVNGIGLIMFLAAVLGLF
jgi:membrane protease YdiL (CAAX protease family)